jgi:hypothetical protein
MAVTETPVRSPRLPPDDGLDLSYKPSLVDASGSIGHRTRPHGVHDATFEPVAAPGENDVTIALALAQEDHAAFPRPVGRPHFGADRMARWRHLLDNDGGGRIPLQAAFDADVDVVELESPFAAAGASARPDLDHPPDDDQRRRLDELREVLRAGGRGGDASGHEISRARAPRRQNGGEEDR